MTVLTAPESGYTYAAGQNVTILDCARCGMTFGITEAFEKRRRDDHARFYCPNGHAQSYGQESETERAKRLLADERAHAGRLAAQRDQLRADLRGARARGTRFRNDRDRLINRALNGVCPCCGRTFKQLARHMASQHPDYGPPDHE